MFIFYKIKDGPLLGSISLDLLYYFVCLKWVLVANAENPGVNKLS